LHGSAQQTYRRDVIPKSLFSDDGCSLRSRKREETRRALTEAAYALVRDRGFEGLTAEAVAERAGVSRRTFFNYFPSVESVLTASVTEFFASIRACLEARPADEDVLDSALAVVTDPADGTLTERIGVLAAAGEASPHARGLILVELHSWLEELEGWLRSRLPSGSSDFLVATYASTLCAAAEASFRVWARSVATAGPDDVVPSVQDNLAAAVASLRTGLDPARTATS
jgi:AcrR family transcriptional regulator